MGDECKTREFLLLTAIVRKSSAGRTGARPLSLSVEPTAEQAENHSANAASMPRTVGKRATRNHVAPINRKGRLVCRGAHLAVPQRGYTEMKLLVTLAHR